MIGRFPWDPFPAGEPDPKGPDPVHAAVYRGAVTGADAYRGVRQVLRVERGVLRVGNRFVPEGRYRQVGFLAVGHAAASMALAVVDALGAKVTQGFVAGPDAPPAYLPFRSVVVSDGWGPHPAAPQVREAALEIGSGLGESDLLLVLVSPGASRAVAGPLAGASGAELGRILQEAHARGASGPDVGTLARALGAGGLGGRLLPPAVTADVQTLVVDRGEGAVLSGGGPTLPVTPSEVERARDVLTRTGLGAEAQLGVDAPAPVPRPLAPGRRPVVVAGPSDALRGATEVAFDKGWTTRVGDLLLASTPEATVDRMVQRTEEFLPDARRGSPGHSKGLVVVSMTTLDVPDGAPEEPACRQFVERAQATMRRREASSGLYRTAGPLGSDPARPDPTVFAGAVVGNPTELGSSELRARVRALRMRPGITDVGFVAAVVVPTNGESSEGGR